MKSACLIIGFFWCGLFTYSQKNEPKIIIGGISSQEIDKPYEIIDIAATLAKILNLPDISITGKPINAILQP